MTTRDRHGRAGRADDDPARRPRAGFRTRDRVRFVRLAQQAVAGLPEELRRHVAGAHLDVVDVPDPDAVADPVDGVALARVHLAAPGRPAVLVVHRRPIELRAATRAGLAAELTRAIRNAVHTALGNPPEDDEDDW